jgi:hypothetical protein
MLPNEILAQLEARRAGTLSETEQKNLQAALDELPEGQQEAAVYERLWAGLDVLHHEEQTTRFTPWEQEWQATDDTELIEWYLAGELSAANAKKVEDRKKVDPAFATVLAEQERLQQGFAAAREDKFRQNLRRWDQSGATAPALAKETSLYPRWVRTLAVAAGMLFLIVAGSLWYTTASYDPPALAESYYKPPPMGNTLSNETTPANTYLESFTAAHRLMERQEYAEAYEKLSALSTQPPPADFNDDDTKYYQDNLDWNIVLALVGRDASQGAINRRLERILADPEHTYYGEAVKLRKDID